MRAGALHVIHAFLRRMQQHRRRAGRFNYPLQTADLTFAFGVRSVQHGAGRERRQRFVQALHPEIRAQIPCRRQARPREVRTVRLVDQHLHSVRMRRFDDLADIGHSAVKIRPGHQHRFGGRMLLDGAANILRADIGQLHLLVPNGIDGDRPDAAEHAGRPCGKVRVARKDHLSAPCGVKDHQLHPARRAANERKADRRAVALRQPPAQLEIRPFRVM